MKPLIGSALAGCQLECFTGQLFPVRRPFSYKQDFTPAESQGNLICYLYFYLHTHCQRLFSDRFVSGRHFDPDLTFLFDCLISYGLSSTIASKASDLTWAVRFNSHGHQLQAEAAGSLPSAPAARPRLGGLVHLLRNPLYAFGL